MKALGGYEHYRELIGKGIYAKKQIFCKDWFVSWSHGSRFQFGYRMVEKHSGGTLLDYGCGDGTFLALASHLFQRAVGADLELQHVTECSARFSEIPNLAFVSTAALAVPEHQGRYDVVVCMEVLEHCLPEVTEKVLSDLRRLIHSGGTVVISVPVEIGPTLLAKQFLRRAAAWRNLGDYKYFEKYTWREFIKMLLANERTAIERPVFFTDRELRAGPFHGHKGFNWRALKLRLSQFFSVERVEFSPAGWSRGYVSSQAWFICKPLRKPGSKNAE